jgi:hypothetical protein
LTSRILCGPSGSSRGGRGRNRRSSGGSGSCGHFCINRQSFSAQRAYNSWMRHCFSAASRWRCSSSNWWLRSTGGLCGLGG